MKIIASLLIVSLTQAGTYTFTVKKSTDQIVKKVESSRDGYIQINKTPQCGTLTLLDANNKRIGNLMMALSELNVPVNAGIQKLQIIAHRSDCKLNIITP